MSDYTQPTVSYSIGTAVEHEMVRTFVRAVRLAQSKDVGQGDDMDRAIDYLWRNYCYVGGSSMASEVIKKVYCGDQGCVPESNTAYVELKKVANRWSKTIGYDRARRFVEARVPVDVALQSLEPSNPNMAMYSDKSRLGTQDTMIYAEISGGSSPQAFVTAVEVPRHPTPHIRNLPPRKHTYEVLEPIMNAAEKIPTETDGKAALNFR